MKFFKYILFLILIGIIGSALYIAVQPNTYEFSRSKVIKAPASLLYNKVSDFEAWPDFSPWLEQDSNATLTYGSRKKGKGASYSWSGEILGEGSMENTATEINKSIKQTIYFTSPYESSSQINWSFQPTSEGTEVTWAMTGEKDFMTKAYTLYKGSIESLTGPQFERGLIKLDSVVQKDMKKYAIKVEGIAEHGGGFYVYSSTSCKINDLPSKIGEIFPKLKDYVKSNKITTAGTPYVLYHKIDEENNTAMISCCIPTIAKVITTESDILTGDLKPFTALQTTLRGNHVNLKEAWQKTLDYLSKNDLERTNDGLMIASYVTDPEITANPADYLTDLFIAIKK